jgi:DNA-binding transcriptional ArsR family regulator
VNNGSVKTNKIKCVSCFRALGIDARISIYTYLRDHGEATVSTLVGLVKLTQPTVSYHLKDMKDLGLLSSRKSGKEVYYSANVGCSESGCDCVLSAVKFPGESDVSSQ